MCVCVCVFVVVLLVSKKRQPEGFNEEVKGAAGGVGDKVREFLENLRYFRIFIGLWNVAMLACMFM